METKCKLQDCGTKIEKPFYVSLLGYKTEVPLCKRCFDMMTKLWHVDGRMPTYMELVYAYQATEEYRKQREEEERIYRTNHRHLDSLIDNTSVLGGAQLNGMRTAFSNC